MHAESTEARLLDGKQISSNIKSKVKGEVDFARNECASFKPGLAIVQVGDRQDSNVYVGMKIKTGGELGFDARHVKLSAEITEEKLLEEISSLNKDPNIHGIIVQLPLDCKSKIDSSKCTNAVSPEKDVDGLNEINAGRLSRGVHLDTNSFVPCTPRGCMEMLKETGLPVQGKHAVVVGRSKIVGSPMANLLTWANATVTICHSRTQNLDQIMTSYPTK